jgi:uncharacterized protein
MGQQIAMVDYLVIDDGPPHLVANTCTSCGARFFDRRNACAKCGGTDFAKQGLATTATVRAFTIVHRAAPGVPTPYVSAIFDLDGGGAVKANLVGVDPDPARISLGMPVRLTTFVAGTDAEGTEAVAFGFTPGKE